MQRIFCERGVYELPSTSIQQLVNLMTKTGNILVSYEMRCCYYFNSNSASNLVSKSLHFDFFYLSKTSQNHDDGNKSKTASSGTEGKTRI